jgi:hypothetical protein
MPTLLPCSTAPGSNSPSRLRRFQFLRTSASCFSCTNGINLANERQIQKYPLAASIRRSGASAMDIWRYANHIPTRAEAIRRLIELDLEALRTKQSE